ncbi:MAG: histidinol-phosphate transaminase [Chloroflexota bacterium]
MSQAGRVRRHILEMPAYTPVQPLEALSQQFGVPVEQIIKLDANENPFGPLPEVRQALAALPDAHIYPDPQSRALRAGLAAYHGVPVETLLAGAGADELIDLLLRLLIEPGEAVINCPPTFGMYRFDGDVNRARVVNVPRRADFSLDVDAIEAAVRREQARLIFIASPNNPDGSLADPAAIERLLQLPALLALDEAYIEFAPLGSSRIGQVAERDNLVVLRTFSKWAGLAGLRAGYGAFPAALIPHLWKIKQPYNLSAAAAAAAQVSLQHASRLEAAGRRIIAERERLFAGLQVVAYLRPYPSQANFILCQVLGRSAAELRLALARRGVVLRYFDAPGLRDHIRISIGLPEHTDRLLQLLREI